MQNNTTKSSHKKTYLLVLSYILSAVITKHTDSENLPNRAEL